MNQFSLLSPFGWLFGAIGATRRKLYENGFFKTHDLGVPVVSVGNLTVGGTGKTPLVAFVARALAAKGHKVCVLTRGYKRRNPNGRVLVSDGEKILADAAASGDEPFELAEKLLDAKTAVIADKRRAAAGFWAKENLGATAFVLDDAFQHFQLKRDLDIVCVDATNPFGNGRLLPAGILREPLAALKRADLIVLTRTNLIEKVQILKSKVQSLADCPVLLSTTRMVELKELNQKSKIKNQKSKIGFAFCAVGNPEGFYETLRYEDFEFWGIKAFPDHHEYSQKDIEKIERAAHQAGANFLLTTAKDAVKLQNLNFTLPCFVVEVETVFESDAPLREKLAAL